MREHLTGLGPMLRFQLRRDRVRLPAWCGGLAMFVLYVVVAIPQAYGDDEELRTATTLFRDPVGRLFTGPGFGFDEPTLERFVVNGYGLYLMVMAGLMNLLLVVRHTRQEEETGRAELVRAAVVGRHAPLVATLLLAVLANVVVAAAVSTVMVGVGGFGVAGSVLFATGLALTGLVFTGVATITAQVTTYSRAAAAAAGGVLGAAFAVRAVGDMVREGGSFVSWLSPLAWAQQTAPFVLDRWWPLALTLVTTVVLLATGVALSLRRDFGSGLRAVRPGPERAPAWLGTTGGLTLRLQRAVVVGWLSSLAVSGLLFGAFADALLGAVDDLPDVFVELFSAEDMLAGYLAYMAVFMAYLAGMYAIHAIERMRSEEDDGGIESVLATAVSRQGWFGANVAVAISAVIVIMLVVGVATGVGAALVTGEGRHVADLTLAHLNHVPSVLVVLGLAAALYGWFPRAVGLSWGVVGYGLLVGTFGPLLDLPQVAFDVSPFEHAARLPLDGFRLVPLVLLTVVALVLGGVGALGFRRRDLVLP